MDQTKRVVEIVGFKLAPWEMDGKKGVTAELYRSIPLDGRKNDSSRKLKGHTTAVVKVDPTILERVAHLTPPFHLELTEQEMSNGKTTQQVVVDVKPVDLKKAA